MQTTDLITPVVFGIFGGVALLAVFAFYILTHRTASPRFETQDYYQTYRKQEKPRPNFSQNPFRKQTAYYQGAAGNQKKLAIAIVALAILAIMVSALFDVFEGLLIIFMLPIIVRFVRARQEENRRRASQGENEPSV